MHMKSRIAIFLGGYLPAQKYGGPVTSIYNLTENLGDELDFFIVSHDHDLGETTRLPGIQDGWNPVGKAKVLYIQETDFSYKVFRRILAELNADVVYLSSVFYYSMNFPAIRAARSLGIPIILATRGELNCEAIAHNKWKKNPYLFLINAFHFFRGVSFQATSEEEYQNIRRMIHTFSDKVFLLPNFPPLNGRKETIKKEVGRIKLLSVSRLVKNKNVLYSIRLLHQVHAFVEFDIYGPVEDEEYWSKCEEEIKKSPSNIVIRYCGSLSPEDARTIYYNYDGLLLPTQFENYGQVIAEALGHDCPIIISRGTTPWDDAADHGAGYCIPIGDDARYVEAIEEMSNLDNEGYCKMLDRVRTYAAKKMDVSQLKKKYVEVFQAIRIG